ncbi:MAG TPA: NADH-quinone oxidoreductase subunit N, partial [Verrucomicrobiae bacterium]|nr:NADH-quinone oxidoreductase subunit N [Verrucomicrobiae bacterium]
MIPFDYKLLLIRLLPETILVVGALIALFLDQTQASAWKPESRSCVAGIIGAITIFFGGFAVWQSTPGTFYSGVLAITPFIKLVRITLLLLAGATLLIAAPSRFTVHIGEYTALLLLATVGLILLVATEELLTAFISLELTSLSLYLLTAFNKQNIHSAEAALKYFLFGSIAAAFTLFGISLVFGLSGSTTFGVIAAGLRNTELNSLLITAIVLVAVGFGFKMAVAPFHLWAPDAYQGAPVPSAALIASGSKLASLILFLKFFVFALPAQAGSAALENPVRGWTMTIAAISAASMICGNLLAIAQSNFRRLLAYSAVAHAGYALLAVLARNENGAASAVYYMFTYGLTVVGIFGIVGLIEERHGELTIGEFAGLSRRAPVLAIPLFVF